MTGQDRNHFDEAGQVVLKPDIVWKIQGLPVAVIDAKYKAEKPAGYPNAGSVPVAGALHGPRPAPVT